MVWWVAEQRPAQRDEHPALRRGDVGAHGELAADQRRRDDTASWRAKRERRLADRYDVSVLQATAADDALGTDERAVARQAVVGDRPVSTGSHELGMRP